MLTLIFGSLLFTLGVILLVLGIKDDYHTRKVGMGIISICVALIIVPSFISGGGYSDNYKRIPGKEQIEYNLQNDLSVANIEAAISYNNEVDQYNDYWHRFTIEDRSLYKINIDDYLK